MESLVTNLDLFLILKDSGDYKNSQKLLDEVFSRLSVRLSSEDYDTMKEFSRRFCLGVIKRWKAASQKFEIFVKSYENWLQSNIDWPNCVQENIPPASEACAPGQALDETEIETPIPSTSSSVGTCTRRRTHRKAFEELGTKQKIRRVEEEHREGNELMFATVLKLKQEGNDKMASIVEYLMKHPEAADKFESVIKKSSDKQVFSPEKALGLFLSLKLSKWQYITLRENTIRESLKDLYPSYHRVQKAKENCYPPKNTISITDTGAKITLQGLLDHTVSRILLSLPETVSDKSLTLISKWGFDGASGQSRYKQNVSDTDDASILMTSLVPLKLVSSDDEVVWENPKPCSVMFCRPIQFSFMKESKLAVTDHHHQMDEEIKSLQPTVACNNNKVIHKLKMTMIDGKVCTYLSEARSSATCYLCLAKPSEMNDLDLVMSKPVSTNLYDFGLSPLHAKINTMECLLHIAYRQDIKKWAIKGDNKAIMEAKKIEIQNRFKAEMNLLIDIVKQGSGTTNDGNTARRFFENPDKTAAITGIDYDLIRRFAVILQAISSGENIDSQKFKDYAKKTAEQYILLYNWYYMPTTVHKLLIHGADIIASNAIVPIGSLSEEASEARNKDFRKFREHHSRKSSRVCCNQDILNLLLLTSDPLISSVRPHLDAKKKKVYFAETLDLLILKDTRIEFVDVSKDYYTESEGESEESEEEN